MAAIKPWKTSHYLPASSPASASAFNFQWASLLPRDLFASNDVTSVPGGLTYCIGLLLITFLEMIRIRKLETMFTSYVTDSSLCPTLSAKAGCRMRVCEEAMCKNE